MATDERSELRNSKHREAGRLVQVEMKCAPDTRRRSGFRHPGIPGPRPARLSQNSLPAAARYSIIAETAAERRRILAGGASPRKKHKSDGALEGATEAFVFQSLSVAPSGLVPVFDMTGGSAAARLALQANILCVPPGLNVI